MNVFAKFDEIPSMILEVIKETKRFGRAKFDEIPSMILEVIKETKRFGHRVGRSVGLSDNVKTVYPPTNTVCWGYKNRNRKRRKNKS